MTAAEMVMEKKGITMPSLRRTISGAAERLDNDRPGWEDQIDLDTLDMSNSDRCIAGQLAIWSTDVYEAQRRVEILEGVGNSAFGSIGRGAWEREILRRREANLVNAA